MKLYVNPQYLRDITAPHPYPDRFSNCVLIGKGKYKIRKEAVMELLEIDNIAADAKITATLKTMQVLPEKVIRDDIILDMVYIADMFFIIPTNIKNIYYVLLKSYIEKLP